MKSSAKLGLAALSAVLLSSVAALADGSLKDAAPAAAEAREFKFSWNLGVTNDYIFRGFAQNKGKPSIQGGLDITYGIFYAGLWSSNVNFSPATDSQNRPYNAPVELDLYMGFKPVVKSASGDYNFDIGVIGYTYPGQTSPGSTQTSSSSSLTYVEGKFGLNHDIWKDGNLSQTFFYSPSYQLGTGHVFTSETTFTQTLAAHGKWVPSVSGTYAHQWGNSSAYKIIDGHGASSYTYYNVGTTFTYDTKTSLDFRLWGTDLKNNNLNNGYANDFCGGPSLQCGNRFQATLKYTY